MKWIYNDNYKNDKIISYRINKNVIVLPSNTIINNIINVNNITEEDLNKKQYLKKYTQYKKK